ncbi:DUF3291 domain-containing protein [Streptomyces sp. NBC_00536]|uniref:DUF3291 domain-containing protein n=1 Tax=Streptomyces sp. NBC_00536 TaxID=2975769 RepID=UPI002E81FC6D|nr:DUF3291 domain-containing protein [Streptomyces sp. NBC_00536]WUC82411.1 DUF3291 domain-containing protein [Streptomyces sp. NBC_00536]
MPTLPWTVPNSPEGHESALIMASRFEVRSLKDVPRFFLNSLAAWRQVRKAPGAFGASLVARPFKRTFQTLSAWESREQLTAFVTTEPHRSIMKAMRPTMSGSTFVFWDASVAELPITWAEAERRIGEQAVKDAQGS